MGLLNVKQTLCCTYVKLAFSKSTAKKNNKNKLASFSYPIPNAASSSSSTPPPHQPQRSRPVGAGPLLAKSSRSAAAEKEKSNPMSVASARRRSYTARLPSNLVLRDGLEQPRKRRPPTLFDGKLLAQNFLKQVESQEADTVHAISRFLHSELKQGMKRRADEFIAMSSRVSGIEKNLGHHLEAIDEIKETLREIRAQSSGAQPGEPMPIRVDAQVAGIDV